MWQSHRPRRALSLFVTALLFTPSLCSFESNTGPEQTSVPSPNDEYGSNVINNERYVAEDQDRSSTPTTSTGCSAAVTSTITVVSKRTAADVPISANGTTDYNALSCYSTYSHWRQSYEAWYATAIEDKNWSTTTTTTTLLQTLSSVVTIYPSTGLSSYSLCDGSVRIDKKPLTLTSTYISSYAYEDFVTVGTPTYTAQPCTPSAVDCQYLYDNTNLSWSDPTLISLCGYPAHLGQPCLIAGGPVQLAYFPVTTTDGSKCGANGSTITNTGGPTTVSALGTTLTSGTVYLSFQTLYAYQEGFDVRIGPAFTDFILPLPSSAIYTQCGGWFSAQGTGTPLNYADWNSPIPASAYKCMDRCTTQLQYTEVNGSEVAYTTPSQCNTIWNDFDPILAIPTQVRDLVPAWSSCSFYDAALPNFLYDPPIALKAGTAVATPTPAYDASSTTTSASPASTSYTALAETEAATSTSTSEATSVSTSEETATSASEDTSTSASEDTSTSTTDAGIVITFTVDGKAFTASQGSNAFVIDGTTVSVGGDAEVISGETISLGLQGFVVDASTTVPFSGTDTVVGASTSTSEGKSGSATSGTETAVDASSSASKSKSSSKVTSAASADYMNSAMGASASATTSKKSGAGRLGIGYGMLSMVLGFILLV